MTTLAVRELADRVVVTPRRPEARNAVNAAMVRELRDVCAALEERPRLRRELEERPRLRRELGERFEPPRLLRDKVARGALGRKSGQGVAMLVERP